MLTIVGNGGGASVGEALLRAGRGDGVAVRFIDVRESRHPNRWVNAISWRLGRRPAYLRRFSRRAADLVRRHGSSMLITTGYAPLLATDLHAIGRAGVIRVNYSTDDPWNPRRRATWYLEALKEYDVVFSPRMMTLEDFRSHGVPRVRHLPFAYDPSQCVGAAPTRQEREALGAEVLFVGGADEDRAPFARAVARAGFKLALYGGYWSRFKDLRPFHRGIADPETIRKATLAAQVVLVLVRRSNRDGHTMRSFEAAATGGCLLVEDTAEHRDILGPDGQTVRYFVSPRELVERARWLIRSPDERARLAAGVITLIRQGPNTYADRLHQIMTLAGAHSAASTLNGRDNFALPGAR